MKSKAVKKLRIKNLSDIDNPIFSGEYRVSVYENRLILPEGIYNQLKSINGLSDLRITRSPEGCIAVVPAELWNSFCHSITQGKDPLVKDRLLKTSMAPAEIVNLENRRRLTIPCSFVMSHLRNAERVVVVGLPRWIEIWSEEEWERSLVQLRKER